MPVYIQEVAETGVNSQAMSFEADLYPPEHGGWGCGPEHQRLAVLFPGRLRMGGEPEEGLEPGLLS